MRIDPRLAAFALSMLLAACGGGASRPAAVPAPVTTAGSAAAQDVTVTFSLTVPSATPGANKRRPSYVPASAKTVTVSVNGGTAQSTALTGGATQTISVMAPLGSDSFNVTLIGTSGKPVSHATSTFTVVLNGANAFALTLLPVVAAASADPTTTVPAFGTALSNVSVGLLNATDADGNSITAPFDATTLTYTDATSHLTPASGPVANGALAYDGLCMPPIAMTMTSLAGTVATFTYGSNRIAATDAATLATAVTTVNANGGIVALTASGGASISVNLTFNGSHPMTVCGQGPSAAILTWNGSGTGTVLAKNGSLTLADLAISGNGLGYAIINTSNVTVTDAVVNAGGAIGIENTEISGVVAQMMTLERTIVSGGSLCIYANAGAQISIDRSTITNCQTGVLSYQPTLITKSTLSGNETSIDVAELTISGSIVDSLLPGYTVMISSPIDLGYNDFVDAPDAARFSNAATSLHIDPLLGLLENNGGPTSTFLPQTGSPVIGAIPSGSCPADLLDQRGYLRPSGSVCSIGSVDVNAVAP